MAKLKLDIKGMHCGMCANSIEMMLSAKAGVKKAEVSWDTKKAIVEYEPEKITIDEILKTVASTGEYTAMVINDEGGA